MEKWAWYTLLCIIVYLYKYIYLFAVARWLLCLLSDYKSATGGER